MATYKIRYDNGLTEKIEAVTALYDIDESQYRFVDQHDRDVAFVPGINVLSVVVEEWGQGKQPLADPAVDAA